jgi:hypothetical protein
LEATVNFATARNLAPRSGVFGYIDSQRRPPAVEPYRIPTREEMGPHPADGAWAYWLREIVTRYSLALFLLAFAALGMIYTLWSELQTARRNAPLPVPPPTQQQVNAASWQIWQARQVRAARGLYFCQHPWLKDEARREGFEIIPAAAAEKLTRPSITISADGVAHFRERP